MKGWRIVFVIGAVASSQLVLADCPFPKSPQQLPDGKTASETEMMEAMSAFKTYNGDVTNYTACLEKETKDKVREASGGAGVAMQIKTLQAKKHNAAMSELQEKATQFNEQVRLFKSRAK